MNKDDFRQLLDAATMRRIAANVEKFIALRYAMPFVGKVGNVRIYVNNNEAHDPHFMGLDNQGNKVNFYNNPDKNQFNKDGEKAIKIISGWCVDRWDRLEFIWPQIRLGAENPIQDSVGDYDSFLKRFFERDGEDTQSAYNEALRSGGKPISNLMINEARPLSDFVMRFVISDGRTGLLDFKQFRNKKLVCDWGRSTDHLWDENMFNKPDIGGPEVNFGEGPVAVTYNLSTILKYWKEA